MQKLTDEQLAAKSEAFRKFYASLQDSDPRDGPQIDTVALQSLWGDERVEAENILIYKMEGTGGPVIEALADMKSLRGATALKNYSEKAGGCTAVEIALALWRIEQWPKAQAMLIDVLEGRLKYFPDSNDLDEFEATGRAEAAKALAYIPGAKSEAALNRALNDPDTYVRDWAQISLNVLTARDDSTETSLTRSIRARRNRRRYDWFGYAIWFICGMLLGGVPIFFHLVTHTVHFSMPKLFGFMLVCGLIGGLLWGRKHRNTWENENRADEFLEEIIRSKRD